MSRNSISLNCRKACHSAVGIRMKEAFTLGRKKAFQSTVTKIFDVGSRNGGFNKKVFMRSEVRRIGNTCLVRCQRYNYN